MINGLLTFIALYKCVILQNIVLKLNDIDTTKYIIVPPVEYLFLFMFNGKIILYPEYR